ncbi:hypothetical protein BGZ99_000777 [Dissophora globulifera]|uniref:Uncharacterized protein n=1 Tax=Dissophora globulifera TaxID=979702 RepID=A0A9P6R415_9FUNG|nr:hypothetical protein BGZ99_000777 [Dissophora globulifera]
MKAIYKKSTDIGVGEVSFKACIAKDQGDLRRTAIWAKRALNGVHAKFVFDRINITTSLAEYVTRFRRSMAVLTPESHNPSASLVDRLFVRALHKEIAHKLNEPAAPSVLTGRRLSAVVFLYVNG